MLHSNIETDCATALHQQSTFDDRQSFWPYWSIFLGISWTWCIGMFLPVLLIRDYGNAAFWAFAIPNVLGAAAMGWVLASPESSAAFVARHRLAVRSFSLVTIAFHAFFVGWICQIKGDALWPALSAVLMLAWMVPAARRFSRAGPIAVAVFTLLASAGLGAAIVATIRRIDLALIVQRRVDAANLDLLALAAVCALGFLTCPYLDATFHQARQQLATPVRSRLGFGVGFGVVFASMIGLTYVYADVIYLAATMRGSLGTYIAAHIAIQAAATVALHAATPAPRWSGLSLVPMLIGGGALAVGGWLADSREGELVYRLFMSFYGLAAPTYVWLCCLRGDGPPTRGRWILVALTTLAAAPFYWMAFIERQMAWGLIGVGIVLAARLPAAFLRPRA